MPAAQASVLSLVDDFDAPEQNELFADLVDQYSGDLYRYAYWLCKDPTQAQDLVQETFLRAWRAIDRLREPGAIKSWLFTILRRENARLYERIQPEWQDLEPDSLSRDKSAPQDIENWLLHRHIADLDPKYREPLVLQVLGGFSCEEIGAMLGLSRGAIMTRVFRAKQQLRDKLAG